MCVSTCCTQRCSYQQRCWSIVRTLWRNQLTHTLAAPLTILPPLALPPLALPPLALPSLALPSLALPPLVLPPLALPPLALPRRRPHRRRHRVEGSSSVWGRASSGTAPLMPFWELTCGTRCISPPLPKTLVAIG